MKKEKKNKEYKPYYSSPMRFNYKIKNYLNAFVVDIFNKMTYIYYIISK